LENKSSWSAVQQQTFETNQTAQVFHHGQAADGSEQAALPSHPHNYLDEYKQVKRTISDA
jgi:hypothetical protein